MNDNRHLALVIVGLIMFLMLMFTLAATKDANELDSMSANVTRYEDGSGVLTLDGDTTCAIPNPREEGDAYVITCLRHAPSSN